MDEKVKTNILVILLVACLMFISGVIGYNIANEETKEWQELTATYLQRAFYWKIKYQDLLWNDTVNETSSNITYPYSQNGYDILLQDLIFPYIPIH